MEKRTKKVFKYSGIASAGILSSGLAIGLSLGLTAEKKHNQEKELIIPETEPSEILISELSLKPALVTLSKLFKGLSSEVFAKLVITYQDADGKELDGAITTIGFYRMILSTDDDSITFGNGLTSTASNLFKVIAGPQTGPAEKEVISGVSSNENIAAVSLIQITTIFNNITSSNPSITIGNNLTFFQGFFKGLNNVNTVHMKIELYKGSEQITSIKGLVAGEDYKLRITLPDTHEFEGGAKFLESNNFGIKNFIAGITLKSVPTLLSASSLAEVFKTISIAKPSIDLGNNLAFFQQFYNGLDDKNGANLTFSLFKGEQAIKDPKNITSGSGYTIHIEGKGDFDLAYTTSGQNYLASHPFNAFTTNGQVSQNQKADGNLQLATLKTLQIAANGGLITYPTTDQAKTFFLTLFNGLQDSNAPQYNFKLFVDVNDDSQAPGTLVTDISQIVNSKSYVLQISHKTPYTIFGNGKTYLNSISINPKVVLALDDPATSYSNSPTTLTLSDLFKSGSTFKANGISYPSSGEGKVLLDELFPGLKKTQTDFENVTFALHNVGNDNAIGSLATSIKTSTKYIIQMSAKEGYTFLNGKKLTNTLNSVPFLSSTLIDIVAASSANSVATVTALETIRNGTLDTTGLGIMKALFPKFAQSANLKISLVKEDGSPLLASDKISSESKYKILLSAADGYAFAQGKKSLTSNPITAVGSLGVQIIQNPEFLKNSGELNTLKSTGGKPTAGTLPLIKRIFSQGKGETFLESENYTYTLNTIKDANPARYTVTLKIISSYENIFANGAKEITSEAFGVKQVINYVATPSNDDVSISLRHISAAIRNVYEFEAFTSLFTNFDINFAKANIKLEIIKSGKIVTNPSLVSGGDHVSLRLSLNENGAKHYIFPNNKDSLDSNSFRVNPK